jgi:hypothetical protein
MGSAHRALFLRSHIAAWRAVGARSRQFPGAMGDSSGFKVEFCQSPTCHPLQILRQRACQYGVAGTPQT